MRGIATLLWAAGCAGDPAGGVRDADDGGSVRDASPRPDASDPGDAGTSAPDDAEAVADGGAAVLPDPACRARGCLRGLTRVGRFTREDLSAWLDPDVVIANGYTLYTLRYASGADGPHEIPATLAVPDVAAPAGGFGIVVNAHGTTGAADACAVTGTALGAGLAGLFGARGAVGIAPDYTGLGAEGLHPYLVADDAADTVFDAMRAATATLEHLGIATSGRFAAVGLSQGGHAVLSAAARHRDEAPELDVRAFAAAGPASVWPAHWRAGLSVRGPHLAYHALLMWTWAALEGVANERVFAPDLATTIDGVLGTRCLFPPATDAPGLDGSIPDDAEAVFDEAFLEAYRTGTWAGFERFARRFEANRVAPFLPTAPLRLYQGSDDAVVLEGDTREVVEALRAGGATVEYRVVDGGGHVGVAFGPLAAAELRTEESTDWVLGHLYAPD